MSIIGTLISAYGGLVAKFLITVGPRRLIPYLVGIGGAVLGSWLGREMVGIEKVSAN